MTTELTDEQKTTLIRDLNDKFRTTFKGGVVQLSPSVQELEDNNTYELLKLIRAYDSFEDGDDPYKEHDFGFVYLNDEKYYFKIDYYDKPMEYGSEKPWNEEETTRVMTIMTADEY